MDQPTPSAPGIALFKPELKKIDFSCSEAFAASLAGYLGKGARIVLDLSNVVFIDSSGLGKIVTSLRSFRAAGGDLRICGVQEPVKVLFSMVRLGELVGIDEDANESARRLAGPGGTDVPD